MVSTFAPFIISVLVTSLFCVTARKPFGKCIVPALFTMSVVMYLSQYLLGSFQPGVYALYLMALLPIPLFFVRNGGPSANKDYILTGGFFAYIGCLLVISLMDAGRALYNWDELMHWGKMVKEMMRLDRFYCVTESTLYRHKDYPPFIALFEYAWCRLGGKYSEPHVAQSIHLLGVTMIAPYLFEQFPLKKKNIITAVEFIVKGALAAVLVLVLCSFCDPNTDLNSIYEDITIALMFSYSALLIYGKEYRTKWGKFAYALSLVALIGTKQIGIAYIGLSLLYLFMSAVVLGKDKEETKESAIDAGAAGDKKDSVDACVTASTEKKHGLICAVIAVAAAGAYYISWNLVTARYPINRQFELGSNISVKAFLKILADSSDRVHRDMLKRFIFALFERNIACGPITITYFTSLLIVLLILAALAYWCRNRFTRRDWLSLGAVFLVGEGGYALMMLMLYELCFETEEMEGMHSFARYMGSYFLAELMLLAAIAVLLLGRKNPIWQKARYMLAVTAIATVLVVPGKMSFLVPQGIHGDRLYDTRQNGIYISEHVPEGSSIYLAYERTQGDLEQIRYSYFVDGSSIDHSYYNLAENNIKNLDLAQVENTLLQDDYLYTLKTTKGIRKVLSAYYDGEKIKNYTLYRIEEAGGKPVLVDVTD